VGPLLPQAQFTVVELSTEYCSDTRDSHVRWCRQFDTCKICVLFGHFAAACKFNHLAQEKTFFAGNQSFRPRNKKMAKAQENNNNNNNNNKDNSNKNLENSNTNSMENSNNNNDKKS
jgi:hypothetical protein